MSFEITIMHILPNTFGMNLHCDYYNLYCFIRNYLYLALTTVEYFIVYKSHM